MPKTPVDVDDAAQKHWDLANRFLDQIRNDANAAYRLGITSALCMMLRLEPTEDLFTKVCAARSMEDVTKIFDTFKRQTKRDLRRKADTAYVV